MGAKALYCENLPREEGHVHVQFGASREVASQERKKREIGKEGTASRDVLSGRVGTRHKENAEWRL